MEFNFPDVHEINSGYLASPVLMDTFKSITNFDECTTKREDTGWDEYVISCSYPYPDFLKVLYELGIPFQWEYQFTEDFSYYAYFFPTEDDPTYHGFYSTTDRKNKPKGLRKKLNAINTFAAASELLFKIGVNPNGTN